MSENGLVTIASHHSVKATIDRLEASLGIKNITVFARIDHAGGAHSVGLELRPTELLIFGHPRGGTALMQSRQTIGIDLPLKALAWEDEGGQVWLTYNDLGWLATRHDLAAAVAPAVDALGNGLTALAAAAAAA